MRDRVATTVLVLSLLGGIAVAEPVEIPNLGRIDFPSSGGPEAREAFVRGVLLLHSFEYEDARESFRDAQTADPDFALAYWGEAMTHNHPLWRQQDREAARGALARLAPTRETRLAKAPTERERGYLQAVEVLFGEGEKVERDRAYEEAMGELSNRFPGDLEAKAFHALSILGTTQGVRDFRTYMRAAAVAEEVFAVNDRHPGAVHYLIHSYDDPIHAPLGLRPARVYAEIAPAASHAQHMISHIYVALGRWKESIDANVRSFQVSRERRERKELSVEALNFHSFHWLHYSLLQRGRFDEARERLEAMVRYAEESRSPRSAAYLAAMRAGYVVETGTLDPPPAPDLEGVGALSRAQTLFTDGRVALEAGELEAETRAGGAVPEETLREIEVLERELQALLALAEGRSEAAVSLLEEATEMEESRPLEYGPPDIVKPSHELLGEILLELGRPGLAKEKFETALERAPRRALSLAGLARAAAASGDLDRATEACEELRSVRKDAVETASIPRVCGGAGGDRAG